jgi:hypothetical protein
LSELAHDDELLLRSRRAEPLLRQAAYTRLNLLAARSVPEIALPDLLAFPRYILAARHSGAKSSCQKAAYISKLGEGRAHGLHFFF